MGGEERWCMVTGGRGFAARHLVVMLLKHGIYSVRVADLGPAIMLDSDEENGVLGEALNSGRAQYVSADLRGKLQVLKGTKNVIDACIKLKVKRLIYTSSPSVVFDGVHEILNGDESLPYPPMHNDSYSATKAEGEALVIKSNGTNGLLTCCIRPSSIFGPGDKLLVPSLVAAARAGKSKFIIGDGNNMYDFTYVKNVVHAHVCAERALASEKSVAEKAAGQEGLRRTIESYTHLRAGVQTKTDGQSKVSGSLPTRRNNKQTVTVDLIFIAICFSLIVTGYTTATTVSKLLLAASVFLFLWGRLSQKM